MTKTNDRAVRPGDFRSSRVWLNLWPLGVFLGALAAAGHGIWLRWPQILLQMVQWQKQLHQHMVVLLQEVQGNPHHYGATLLLFSFVYGILHAVGPGHGKVVITTYLATHRSRLRQSLLMTLAAALLQGSMAIILVTLTLNLLRLSSRTLHLGQFWLEKASFVLVGGLGLWLCWRALKRLQRLLRAAAAQEKAPVERATVAPDKALVSRAAAVQDETLVSGAAAAQKKAPVIRALTSVDHHHHADCGCGHRHLPRDEELRAADGWYDRAAVVVAMGLRPCSGAVLVLLFAKVIGVYAWGVLSALMMAAGTALTLLALALLVFFGRSIAERLITSRAPSLWRNVVWTTLALAGGVLLVGAGALLYFSAVPEMVSGIRPFSV